MQEELKRSTQKVLSAEERAQEIDSRLTEEEEYVQQLEKELANLREKQVHHHQPILYCVYGRHVCWCSSRLPRRCLR